MPVIPSASQIDQWYALPFEVRNSTTLDQWLGNTPDAAPAPDTSRQSAAPTPDMPIDFPAPAGGWQISDPGRQRVQPVPAYTQSLTDPFAAQRAAYDPSAPPAGPGSPTLPASFGGPLPPGQTPPPGYDATIVYTDRTGRGYTPQQLAQAVNDPTFMSDPLNARVRDIVQQYGAVLGPSASASSSGSGAPAPGGQSTATPYNGSSQSLLLNAVLQRLKQLQTPADTSLSDLLTKYGLGQVDKLNGAPFTDQQTAALLTKNMEPLTQARDAAKQQAAEQLARRGIQPSSGVFIDTMNKIDQAYQRGVSNVTNTLNVQGIDQVQKNNALQLSILSSLSDIQRINNQIADQRSQELVTTAGIPFSTDLQTLQALTAASGGNNDASSLISSLLSLGGLNLQGSQIANQNSSANAQALASVIGYILNSHLIPGL